MLHEDENFKVLDRNKNGDENETIRAACSRSGSRTASLIRQGFEKATDLETYFLNTQQNLREILRMLLNTQTI